MELGYILGLGQDRLHKELVDLADTYNLEYISYPGKFLVINPHNPVVLVSHLDTINGSYQSRVVPVEKNNHIYLEQVFNRDSDFKEHIDSIRYADYIEEIMEMDGDYDLKSADYANINQILEEEEQSLDDDRSINHIITDDIYCLGGDDRCGVYIMAKLIEEFTSKHYTYMFFWGEETGCIGSKYLSTNFSKLLKNKHCFIGLDRSGKNDIALYNYNNWELINIFYKMFGYRATNGTITDVAILARNTNISCINLSVGFYNEHTLFEYINLNHITNTLNILKNTTLIKFLKSKKFRYKKKTPTN